MSELETENDQTNPEGPARLTRRLIMDLVFIVISKLSIANFQDRSLSIIPTGQLKVRDRLDNYSQRNIWFEPHAGNFGSYAKDKSNCCFGYPSVSGTTPYHSWASLYALEEASRCYCLGSCEVRGVLT
jgi:hypothetical protein